MTTSAQIEERLTAYIAEAVACHVISAEDGRVGCQVPLQYPDGDGVTVWVRPRIGDSFEVTDYGEALAEAVSGKTKERERLEEFASEAAAGQGARFVRGRLFAECRMEELAEYVWRVGVAAAQLGQAAAASRPRQERQKGEEDEFVSTVAHEFTERHVTVERGTPLDGRSSHKHRATFYLPRTETVIEPVAGHWNQVTSVFARLADLGGANGYKLFSLLDDRAGKPEEDVPGLLVQVSNVVQWTRRDEWFSSVVDG